MHQFEGELNRNTFINQILIYFVIVKKGENVEIILINPYISFKDEKIYSDFIL
jgi:hypothetical protein